ncbi:FAD-binding domain-containing protein [Mycena alexandri]|uniref:FAD-binding domain-containing protein n=1 Tax=Mycena alexandri TaxID=1745969 RepID=A0AAD6WZ08_9AGAR|nr:FAD-binding domain-containing protein [Mycena alexandri]
MRLSSTLGFFLVCALFTHFSLAHEKNLKHQTCRNVPGSAGYPKAAAWSKLNATIGGRLVNVIPTAKYCARLPGGACTDAQWTSALFRSTIPGSMSNNNLEQGYDLTPPSLCLRNATSCGQGDVPIFSVEAQSAADIQAAVKFASSNNLRLVVKSSGHDVLGRSTAPYSLLIRTAGLQDIVMTDAFFVGTRNMGSAVTLGSGVHAQTLYQKTKANGKIVVAPTAATVCPAGGYVQGAGHSALSPLFGLAADNVLEFHIVVASGEVLQVNSISHPDFRLLNVIDVGRRRRSGSPTPTFIDLKQNSTTYTDLHQPTQTVCGGAGSWGVILSATFRTFPTFDEAFSVIEIAASSNAAMGALAAVHAHHIFDLEPVRAGQYFYVFAATPNATALTLQLLTHIPNTTAAQAAVLLAPFRNAALALPGVSLVAEKYVVQNVNDALFTADDTAGDDKVIGSRLIPASVFRERPETVGKVYKQLLDAGALQIASFVVAGGQVAANADILSAVHPAWRTAKTHLLTGSFWTDQTPLSKIDVLRRTFQTIQLPIMEQLSGNKGAAYSNEADVIEPHFQTIFFGPNYANLARTKAKYDSADLFIVPAGVGSERWDEWGLCTV